MAKKRLGMEILKNYYQIRNQQPRIDTHAKFSSKQRIFKFRDQIIVKKSNGGKNVQKTITKFLISTLEYIHVPKIKYL